MRASANEVLYLLLLSLLFLLAALGCPSSQLCYVLPPLSSYSLFCLLSMLCLLFFLSFPVCSWVLPFFAAVLTAWMFVSALRFVLAMSVALCLVSSALFSLNSALWLCPVLH